MKALIIPSGGVDENGYPNIRSKLRYDYAIQHSGEYDVILCSTGYTYRKTPLLISEAESGKRYLQGMGVDISKIICEEQSKDTFSNAYFSRKIFDEMGINEITVVTNAFHLKRVIFMFSFVFSNGYTISFAAAEDPPFSVEERRNHELHETTIINFYETHLTQTYGIQAGNMESMKQFIFQYNPAFTGNKDHYHQELTLQLQRNVKEDKLGY